LDPHSRSEKVFLKEVNKVVFDDLEGKHGEIRTFKCVNAGLALASTELFSGKYVWDVRVENNGACHQLGFGICKKSQLIEEDLGKKKIDFKEPKSSTNICILLSNGVLLNGLKGKCVNFTKDRIA
jgi:hypothetical protein